MYVFSLYLTFIILIYILAMVYVTIRFFFVGLYLVECEDFL